MHRAKVGSQFVGGFQGRSAGAVSVEALEGRALLSASISGTVYSDLNGDGLHQKTEPALAKIPVSLFNLNNKNAVVATTYTSSTGAYKFAKLPAGNYRVAALGSLLTTSPAPAYYDVKNVTASSVITGKDFEKTNNAIIGGDLFLDANNNGSPDSGEAIYNAKVTIKLKSSGAVVATAFTDKTGHFNVTTLPAGTYLISAVPTTGAVFAAGFNGVYTATVKPASTNFFTFREVKAKQATNLIGKYSGTVNVPFLGDTAATLTITAQTATSITGVFDVVGIASDTGTFTGSIDATGKFSYSYTTHGNTTTLSGQESVDGSKLTGTADFLFSGFPASGSFDFTRTA